MKRAHIGAMKRAHTVAMKRSKLVYTGDTQPKRESVMTPHYASLKYQVKIGEGEVKNAQRLQWCHGLGPQSRGTL
jgi:hypothetical protein